MPTLNDLRDAFDHLADGAPLAVADPDRRSRRRNVPAVVLAAACTVGFAVAVPAIVADRTTHRPATAAGTQAATESGSAAHVTVFGAPLEAPQAGQSPDLAYGFSSGASVYVAIPDRVTRGYQHATIVRGDQSFGDLYVYYRGAFDASQVEQGTPVEVAGTTGYYGQLTPPDSDRPVEGLAWRYSDDGDAADEDAWAVVSINGLDDARGIEFDIAGGTVEAHHPLLSPVRVPSSSGLFVESVADGDNGSLGLDSGAAQTDGTDLGTRWNLGWSPYSLTVGDKPGSTTEQVGGRDWIVYRDRETGAPTGLGYLADGWGLTIFPTGQRTLQQLTDFAASLQFASDPSDRSTWFDAATALP